LIDVEIESQHFATAVGLRECVLLRDPRPSRCAGIGVRALNAPLIRH
jgi:hypothetical protein